MRIALALLLALVMALSTAGGAFAEIYTYYPPNPYSPVSIEVEYGTGAEITYTTLIVGELAEVDLRGVSSSYPPNPFRLR